MLTSEFLVALARKLRAPLSFSLLCFLIGIILRRDIPTPYQPIPFLIGIAGFVLYGSLAFFQIRKQHNPLVQGISSAKNINKSAVANQNRGILLQIVNNYANYASRPDVNKRATKKQLEDYLDWVEESFRNITLRGIEQEGRQVVTLPLERIYVPLCAEIDLREFQENEEIYETEKSNQKVILLNQALRLSPPRLIVTGGPGCGKSTVLQHFAWTLAVAIKSGNAALAEEQIGLKDTLPLPIYVPLSMYASYLRNLPKDTDGEKKTLAYFISKYLLERQTNLYIDHDLLAYLLRDENHILLLLDGLDEIPNDSERYQIRQAIEDLVAGRDSLHVVVTSRTASYHGQSKLGRGFKQLRIMPLNAEQIRSLIYQAYNAIYVRSATLASHKAEELLTGIAKLEESRSQRFADHKDPLVTTPLMVRLLLIVAFNNRALPEQRADLYQKSTDAMLRPDYILDEHVATEIEKRMGGSLAMNRDMLQYLAFHMHSRGEILGHTIEEKDLSEILNREPTYKPYIQELIAQTRQRNTLLEEQNGDYRFIHLSFQEYLVGRYLAQNKDIESIADFLETGPVLDSWWREPVLLLVGYLDINAPLQARRLLLRLARLSGNISNLSYDKEIAGAELAASAFLECQNQADDLRYLLQNRLRTLLEKREIAFLKPILRARDVDILDQLGYIPSDINDFIPITKHLSLGYLIGKYPVTNGQYARFLNASDFGSRDFWVGFRKFDERGNTLRDSWDDTGWHWLMEELQNKDNIVENGVLYPRFWTDFHLGSIRSNAPVVGISWWEAYAYCQWLLAHWAKDIGFQIPSIIRMPIETEWVFSAGGDHSYRYAWDINGSSINTIDIMQRANTSESGIGRTTPVWMYKQGESQPFGLADVCGNIWEWQANFYNMDYDDMSLRGGAWNDNQISAQVSYRINALPSTRSADIGFRVIAILDPASKSEPDES